MIKRTSRALIFEYLKIFPVVAIIGPRQSGKTTLTQELPSETWGFFDLEKGADYDMISRDPDLFLRLNPKQIVVYEAQILRGLDARGVPDTPYHYRTKRGLRNRSHSRRPLWHHSDWNQICQPHKKTALKALHTFYEDRQLPLGIIINNDDQVRWYSDKIVGIPLSVYNLTETPLARPHLWTL